MAPSQPDPPASNVSERRVPGKRKREVPTSRSSAKSTPNAYARRSPPREQAKRQRSPSPSRNDNDGDQSPPRKQKRPGAGARRTFAERQAADDERRRIDEEQRKEVASRQTTAAEMVAEHYNAVPERGREWRKTDSQIKGLRSLNNWVKSTLIQKFSKPSEYATQSLYVLDMACGKGGDLGKWEKAPQVPALYVGCDIADVSIDQAKDRWNETLRRNRGRHRRDVPMQAEFYVHDAFGRPLTAVPIVNQVGFNPNAGPGGGIIQPGMPSGGFDVVSMMFALHYSYEREDLAKGMLKNISGALKKGGRFFGVMPNSDMISATVRKLLQAEAKSGQTPNGKATPAEPKEKEDGEEGELEDDWDPEKPSGANEDAAAEGDDDDWDPEKPSEPQPPTNGTNTNKEDDEDDWDPEKPSEASAPTAPTDEPVIQPNGATPAQQAKTPQSNLPPLEWGNNLYTVRFPRTQPLTHLPLPKDGVFRPPYGWRYHYQLEEAVDVPEYVVPWEGFRALAEDYGLELMYRKGFKEILDEVLDNKMGADGGQGDERMRRDLLVLAERMGVLSRDRSEGGGSGLLVGEEELEAAAFYHGFCFYKT